MLVAYNNLASLPAVCAVYIVSSQSHVLYVGSSVDIRKRLRNHDKRKLFEELGASKVEWIEVPESELCAKEREIALANLPLLNAFVSRRGLNKKFAEQSTYEAMKFEERLYLPALADVKAALADYMQDKDVYKTIKEIADISGLSESWLLSFRNGRTKDPGFSQVSKLINSLRTKGYSLIKEEA